MRVVYGKYTMPKSHYKTRDKKIKRTKNAVKSKRIGGISYDGAVYILGKFKASYNYLWLLRLASLSDFKPYYTVLKNNCKNEVAIALGFGTNISKESNFRSCLSVAKKRLRPNEAFKAMKKYKG